ncbi:uncharacterized protein LOC125657038 isoform X1 [Ostrea edulis]|uniref:uncharacterized protein LOC125657038 isoform X1 n=1 Tax=Ostrea edulis TaxID=37623 RepID=UPI0024AF4ADD|nr:uncharacterized protein LOC125657038 isoform X1 [Ostrea edulis]
MTYLRRCLCVILCFTMDIPKKVLCFPQNERKICLEQALQVHAMMADQNCPLQDLSNRHKGNNTCSMSCKAIYVFNNDLFDKDHCVEYKINFHYNEMKSTQMTDSLCDIKKCIIENITIECWTQGNNPDQLNIFEHNKENGNECLGPGIIAVLIVTCFVVGCLFGIGILRVNYNLLNRHKDNRFPSPVSYQPSHQERSGLPEGRVIINPLEAEYAGIEDNFRVHYSES